MKGHIGTACFHCSEGREMIYASSRDAEWIHHTSDIRDCFGKLFDKDSGTSILLLSPMETGIAVIVAKMMHNRFGDNIAAFLHVPYGLDVSGDYLKGEILDVISALEKNRRDVVSSCLSSISENEYEINANFEKINICFGDKLAFRKINSSDLDKSNDSLGYVLDNLYQEYYTQYKYIFLSIDGQHIANPEHHVDLSAMPIINWRKKIEKVDQLSSKQEDRGSCEETTNSTDVSDHEEIDQSPIKYTSEWLKSNTEIHGWLWLFFFGIIVGGLYSAIYSLATYNASDYAGNICLGAVDIILGISLLAIAIYTVYSFVKRLPNAVFWGRSYVVLVFLTNILVLISGSIDNSDFQSAKQVFRGIIWGLVWFLYLAFSKQVKEIIPSSFRKVTKIDWLVLTGVVLLPTILYTVGLSQVNNLVDSRYVQEQEVKNTVLAYNERTDGKVIITIPDGFQFDSEDVNVEGVNLTIFHIDKDEIGNCTMCSDYDTDKSRTNFDSYWNGWKDQDAMKYSTENVDRGSRIINGNYSLYRITKYYVNGVYVYWRFYLLFNDRTGKVFVASFYDTNNSTYYVDELLESVVFK